MTSPQLPDSAAAAEALAVGQALPAAQADAAGAADGLAVLKGAAPAPTPGTAAVPAPRVFVLSAMPRMYLQNLVTGQWMHRDVQGISSPSVTWTLNGPDTFTCQLGPPRADLLDITGNPVGVEWQTACYLEQADQIQFGGILTSSSFSGPVWTAGFTGFLGYPPGMVYGGPNYTQTRIDALDVVRYLWSWLQAQPGSNLGMVIDPQKSGALLGSQLQSDQYRATTLAKSCRAGATQVTVVDPTGFAVNTQINIGGGPGWHTVAKISGGATFTLSTPTALSHSAGEQVVQGGPGANVPQPYTLRWWNNTDIGQEIGSIAAEAVFDMREVHTWTSPAKTGVRHQLGFGVPRLGIRQSALRFAEGENIIQPVGGTRDGTAYASEVLGLGAGQGSSQIRASTAQLDQRLRRQFTYTDQTVQTTTRMQRRIARVLASRQNIDTPAQVVITDHPNAPFGSFGPGDDIFVQMASGWRQAGVWARILSMQQDPTTRQMTLALARSDSFTYMQGL